tara:strand:- start:168 stop:707 length:540 start_codon:yes stop_codon:yes gene_type:complete
MMAKRSDFKRVERDYYPTPPEAVVPLIKHLPEHGTYMEPCAGDNRLVNHITDLTKGRMKCLLSSDIEPQSHDVARIDVFDTDLAKDFDARYFITNPPWDRKILHPLIVHLSNQRPTWLLFDADWMHTVQSKEYMKRCVKIVSIGRVKWIEGSKMTGKDNCAWYLFDVNPLVGPTAFYGR